MERVVSERPGWRGLPLTHLIYDEATIVYNEESNVRDNREYVQPEPVHRHEAAGIVMTHVYTTIHKNNVKSKSRAKNRVARKSRRVNRNHKR